MFEKKLALDHKLLLYLYIIYVSNVWLGLICLYNYCILILIPTIKKLMMMMIIDNYVLNMEMGAWDTGITCPPFYKFVFKFPSSAYIVALFCFSECL